MLKKARAQAQAGNEADDEFPQNLKETSRQIWLAGLGAFSRAQAEGMKMFETLVEQGQHLEARTRRAATETAAAAAGAAAQKAKEMQAMAGGTWDKLEQVFEDRVARALSKLGVYTQEDVTRLAERVDALSEAVNALIKSGGGKVPVSPQHRPRRAAGKHAAPAPRARKRTPAKRAAKSAAGVEPASAATAAKAMPAAKVPRKSRKPKAA
jgi:poly(hydroxyalkanoate) granule-associated protein